MNTLKLKPATDHRICFVGDSFVQGTGDPLCLGWAGRVAQDAVARGINLTHYNLGIRRDTSRDIAARWQQECAARLPADYEALVVFSFGVNDTSIVEGVLRVAEEESIDNFQSILRTASSSYKVLMIGPPPMPDSVHNRRVAQLDKQFAELAATLNVPYLSVFEVLRKDAHWLKEAIANDFAHPGKQGYECLARLVQEWSEWWFR
ncbi:putative lipase/esterase [Herminiimonas arsenicoxydans]|uniref:Lipase/esterase n=1 Tax=Herminiimonas arsenicoxydans TaxID=204773 RepID=A4G359_HERAR|nr:putative lipase/esterase [Herminiimonas arsenicoxydans]